MDKEDTTKAILDEGVNSSFGHEIHTHYLRARDVILQHCFIGGFWRCLIGDHWNWYQQRGSDVSLWYPSMENYTTLIESHRTLYWSLNFFLPELRNKKIPRDVGRRRKAQGQLGSLADTMRYSLGIDIDSIGDIHDPEVKKAVEACAKYYIDELRSIGVRRSYDVAFSGGGVYILLHPELFIPMKDEKWIPEDEDDYQALAYHWRELLERYNLWIQDKLDQFYEKHPDCKSLVKADSLNNAKRQWKTLLSVHKKYPYAVIPIDRIDLKIDLDEAELPLDSDVYDKSIDWLTEYDREEKKGLLDVLKSYNPTIKVCDDLNIQIRVSKEAIPIEQWPPCIRNILKAERMERGKTRAVALLATWLGQAGWEREAAYELWDRVRARLGAERSNIFESWYRKMRVPSCTTIQEKGSGFPSMKMGELGLCTPDGRCKRWLK